MQLYLKFFNTNDESLHTEDLFFTTSNFKGEFTAAFSLNYNVFSWIITNTTVSETVEGAYTFTHDVLKSIAFTIAETTYTVKNTHTVNVTFSSEDYTEEYIINFYVTGKQYFGTPEEILKIRLTEICNALREHTMMYDVKINGNYIADFIEDTPNSLLQYVYERGNADRLCYGHTNTSYNSLKFLKPNKLISAQYMFSTSSIKTFNNEFDTSVVSNASCMFQKCTSLTSARLDLKYATNTQYLFSECTALTSVEIFNWGPTSTSNGSIFSGCTKLNKIIFRNLLNYNLGSSAFYNTPFLKKSANDFIYVPSNDLDVVKTQTYWKDVSDYIMPIFSKTTFGEGTIVEDSHDNNVTLTAEPSDGHIFSGWYNGRIVTKYGITEESKVSPICEPIEGQAYGFILNSKGYYESQNKSKHSTTAYGVFNFTVESTEQVVMLRYISYGEGNTYDYGMYYLKNSAGTTIKSKDNMGSSASEVIEELTLEPGEYSLEVRYRKDGSTNTGNDSLQVILEIGDADVTSTIEGVLYSESSALNLNVDESTMDPLNLIAKFNKA